jgi:predicted MFS family arabinose efflux permease
MTDRSRRLMVAMLATVFLFQAADMIIFSMAMSPIQAELRIGDAQLGFLNGSAFALFYAVAAIPLARISDGGRRRNVIAGCLVLWSLFTASTAFASSFSTLFASRLLVGIGEAGAQPATMALIAAAFPPERRTGATSLVQGGRYFGMVVGLWGAGLAIAHLGWRHTFLLFGLPGVALAGLLMVFVKEPVAAPAASDAPPRPSLREVWTGIDRPALRHLFGFLATAALVGAGTIAWSPIYYERQFAMGSGEVGLWLGIVLGMGTVVGTVGGGLICGRFPAVTGLRIAFWTLAVNAPLAVLAFVVDAKGWSLALLLASMVAGGVCMGPIFAAMQTLTSVRIRATAVAMLGVGTVIVGQGFGPLLVGAISDVSHSIAGPQSLRLSMVLITLIGFWPLYHAWRLIKLYPAAVQPD